MASPNSDGHWLSKLGETAKARGKPGALQSMVPESDTTERLNSNKNQLADVGICTEGVNRGLGRKNSFSVFPRAGERTGGTAR